MDDVVVLAVSSSRSDPIQRHKWRCLWEMHTYGAAMTLPSRSSEIWWSGRWDRQHDGVVSMVESMRRQGFACLRGGRRMEKGGFRNRAAAPRKFGLLEPSVLWSFYRRPTLGHQKDGVQSTQPGAPPRCWSTDRSLIDGACMPWQGRVGLRPNGARPNRPIPMQTSPSLWPTPNSERARSSSLAARRDRVSQDAPAAALGRPPPFFLPFLSIYFY
jgi:hypothetical protein